MGKQRAGAEEKMEIIIDTQICITESQVTAYSPNYCSTRETSRGKKMFFLPSAAFAVV